MANYISMTLMIRQMVWEGLNFGGQLGHPENGFSIPVPLYFLEVSKQGKFFGW